MTSSGTYPIAEFRDADHYMQPVVNGEGHEIVRPKPRRPGESRNVIVVDPNCNDIMRSASRDSTHAGTSIGDPLPFSRSPTTRDGISGSTSVMKASQGNNNLKIPRESHQTLTAAPNVPARLSGRDKMITHGTTGRGDIAGLSNADKPPVVPAKNVRDVNSRLPMTTAINHSRDNKHQSVVQVEIYGQPYNVADNERSSSGYCGDRESSAVPGSRMSGRGSPPSTDCGSLSKSSSDSDAVIMRAKRPPTRLKSRRRNILSFPQHLSMDELTTVMPRKQDSCGGSSSDENRSSGHASMSDDHTSSSPLAETLAYLHVRADTDHGHTVVVHHEPTDRHEIYWSHRTPLKSVPEDDRVVVNTTPLPPKLSSRRAALNRSRHRVFQTNASACAKDEVSSGVPLQNASGLQEVRQAIETMSLHPSGEKSRGSAAATTNGYSTSTYSSVSGSESESAVRTAHHRLIRHSSLETINTNVTSADEFVWIDSHSRLVELQHLPWTNHDILRVLQHGRLKDALDRVSMEVVPRLSYLLQRALVRIALEIQRFSRSLGLCSKREVNSALKVILAPSLADSCIKACLRSAAMYPASCGQQLRRCKSARAGLQLSIGRFHRWMVDVRLGRFIHEYAAVYLTSSVENLLEEILLQCLPRESNATTLTASGLEHSIANNGDLWGLLQPYSHLNTGRTASGALAMPRWPSQSSEADRSSNGSGSTGHLCDEQSRSSSRCLEQNLLTTCVGSLDELTDLLSRVSVQYHRTGSTSSTPPSIRQPITWGTSALQTLFYFMRCSQLEHADHRNGSGPIQELIYERPYVVLPPLVEWVRIATAHTEHRNSWSVDKDDVMQAARLLLPGVDCPIRHHSYGAMTWAKRPGDEVECSKRWKTALAYRMLSSGRADMVSYAVQLLPPSKLNTLDDRGLTPLMVVCALGDEAMVQALLSLGADVNIETPANSAQHLSVNPENQMWTALTYATIHNHLPVVKLLLKKNANVEGGAQLNEDKATITPLQLAAATGNLDMVNVLLAHGAHPFLSTAVRDTQAYGSAALRGCYSALSVAAAHGQRMALHKLLSHPLNNGSKEILSLEEILAEEANQLTTDRRTARYQVMPLPLDENLSRDENLSAENTPTLKLNKKQMKTLQEAMYHSAENNHLEITLDLRNIGVPWTLHCWMHTLATANEMHLESVIDQLLQDFQIVWPDECSAQFVEECLPLLFDIFRHSKNEGTSLLLADIFSSCFGKQPIKLVHDGSFPGGIRIDPNYVNNPELSDVQFRVEGRIFYGHKIIIVNSSPCFKAMLSNKFCDGNPPVVQINDIRYDIFQIVMHYLYKGGCENLDLDQNDVLELMAAANFFQLDGLLKFCETSCCKFVDQDNVVAMYIHAKIYSATQLLEYCQGFVLQNLVALLTYDDSVRRLLFGKRLHNQDVLGELLTMLQNRIRHKDTAAVAKKS